jgi:hypothetical protein
MMNPAAGSLACAVVLVAGRTNWSIAWRWVLGLSAGRTAQHPVRPSPRRPVALAARCMLNEPR